MLLLSNHGLTLTITMCWLLLSKLLIANSSQSALKVNGIANIITVFSTSRKGPIAHSSNNQKRENIAFSSLIVEFGTFPKGKKAKIPNRYYDQLMRSNLID